MPDASEQPKISKSILKAAERYAARMKRGERILRDANNRLQWSDGRTLGRKTVEYMLANGAARELDTDLFGDPKRGQTIGLPS